MGTTAVAALIFAFLQVVFPNPVPSLSSISPSTAAAGSAESTLTVTGSGFTPSSMVQWNGAVGQPPIATTYVSATQLTATIPAWDMQFAGTANVTVVNPAPGGGTSSALPFTITGTLPSNARFVSPSGNDQDAGAFDHPYRTISRCALQVQAGGTCAIRAGNYPETVGPNSGIVISSYNGEPVTVDGTDPVTGWSPYQGSIYQKSITLSSAGDNQLFVGNEMMTEARWPNGDDLFHPNWAIAQVGTGGSVLVDPQLPAVNWTGAKIHLWSGDDAFAPMTGTVTSSQNGRFSFTNDGSGCPSVCSAPGGRYYLFGSLAALDAEREWVYDSTAHVLYFWAPGGADPNTISVRIKKRPAAFDLSNASNVTISHIAIFASTILDGPNSRSNTLDGLSAKFVSHYTLTGDHLTDTGLILAGEGDILQNSAVSYSAGAGVSMQGTGNTASYNLIDHTGYMGNEASGVALLGISESLTYNTIHTSGRYSIFHAPGTQNFTSIQSNNLYRAMTLSHDGAAIYSQNTDAPQSTLLNARFNWIHDTQSQYPGPGSNTALSALFLQGTTGSLTQNIVWNNANNNILITGRNDGSNTVVVTNNSVPDANPNGGIALSGITNCGLITQVAHNLVFVPVDAGGSPCTVTDNGPTAPGANQFGPSIPVGCNFTGCVSDGPPAVSNGVVAASISIPPHDTTAAAGSTATFNVIGAGSVPVTYQWQLNGSNITGATGTSYTTPTLTAAANGSRFTVKVTNSLGTVVSRPAMLTVTGEAIVPTISNVSPAAVAAGSSDFSLTIYGTGFTSGSVAMWNGSPRTTTFLTPMQLVAAIPASDVASAGTALITVVTSAPGGGTSTPLMFGIGATSQGSINPTSAVAGGAGLVAYVPVVMTVSSGSVESLTLDFHVTLGAGAPPLTSPPSFQDDSSLPAPPPAIAATSSDIRVLWSAFGAPLAGSGALGVLLIPIPASAPPGAAYTVQIAGASAAGGGMAFPLTPGGTTTITIVPTYLIGDVVPKISDNAGSFGDGSVNTLDLLETLRFVTLVLPSPPPACSDRFDAMDAFPPGNSAGFRGGDGAVNTLDLLALLRLATNVDTSHPARTVSGTACSTTRAAETVRRLHSGPIEASIETDGDAIYLHARQNIDLAGLALSLSFVDDAETSFQPGDIPASLVDRGQAGRLALAWLNGVHLAVGQRLLLGRVPGASLATVGGITGDEASGRGVRIVAGR